MKECMAALDSDNYKHSSLLLSNNLQSLLKNISRNEMKTKLGVFAPLLDEPNWMANFEADNIEFLFPTNSDQGMLFVHCSFDELVETEVFGAKILTPPGKKIEEPDILLVPGMAFSQQGERLGRGKAFYDRYLKKFSGQKIGICFEMQLVERVPTEDHDELVDYVVTEKRVIKIKGTF